MNMPLKLPPIQPRSRPAHEAAKWAKNLDHAAQYNLAVFRAFFEFGLDIGNQQILMDLANEMGLDPEDLAEALDSRRFREEVLRDEEEAQKMGIRAVPSFVSDGRLLASGVQTAERLRELLNSGPVFSIF